MPADNEARTLAPDAVLHFWFHELSPLQWFRGGVPVDNAIKARFGAAVELAAAGAYDHWAETADGALALLLLLDQFPRNLYRDSAQAFAQDAKARAVCKAALDAGFDQALPEKRRGFVYLPLEHSEDLADQEHSVELFDALGDETMADYARRHLAVIARFGRFPHRNPVLGRQSTQEEQDYLEGRDEPF